MYRYLNNAITINKLKEIHNWPANNNFNKNQKFLKN